MVKFYNKDIFDFPRRKKRLAAYVERLCSRLLQLDEISQNDIEKFWDKIKNKQKELPFPWQRENLEHEARDGLNRILSNYQYDPKNKVYRRKSDAYTM